MRRWFSPHTSSLLLRVASAAWGFAVAIALLPHWTRPAQPGQLPGFATSVVSWLIASSAPSVLARSSFSSLLDVTHTRAPNSLQI